MTVSGTTADGVFCRGKEERGRGGRMVAAEGADRFFFDKGARFAELAFLGISGQVAGDIGSVFKILKQFLIVGKRLLSLFALFQLRFLGNVAVIGFACLGIGVVGVNVA